MPRFKNPLFDITVDTPDTTAPFPTADEAPPRTAAVSSIPAAMDAGYSSESTSEPEEGFELQTQPPRHTRIPNRYRLIEMPATDFQSIFPSLTCIKRHLRIDNTYKTNNGHLTPAHYSEHYQDPEGGEITIHCYFDKACSRINIECFKETQGGTKEPITLTERQQQALLKNLTPAKQILTAMRTKLEEQRKNLRAQADAQEAILTKLTKEILNPKQLATRKQNMALYAEQSAAFTETLAELNDLCADEPQDPRAARITEFFVRLEKSLAEQERIAQRIADADDTDDEDYAVDTTPAESATKAKISKTQLRAAAKAEIMVKAEELSERLTAAKELLTDKLGEASQLIEQLRLESQLLTWQLEEISPKMTTLPKAITKIHAELKALPNIESRLEQCCLTGDLATLQTLFPLAPQAITGKLVLSMLAKIAKTTFPQKFLRMFHDSAKITPATPSEKTGIIACCDYLHANSSMYSTATAIFNRSLLNRNEFVFSSFLLDACIEDDLDTFELLLRHGISTDETGIVVQKRSLSCIAATLLFAKSPDFMQALVTHGAIIDFDKVWLTGSTEAAPESLCPRPKRANRSISKASAEHRKLRATAADAIANGRKNFDSLFSNTSGDSPFLTKIITSRTLADFVSANPYCNYCCLPILPLANPRDLIAIAEILALKIRDQANHTSVYSRELFPTDTPGLEVVANAAQLAARTTINPLTTEPHIKVIFHVKSPTDENMARIHNLCGLITALDAVKQRLPETSFLRVAHNLIRKGKAASSHKDNIEHLCAAKLIYICVYQPSAEQYAYMIKLNNIIGKTMLQDVTSAPLQSHSFARLMVAFNAFNHCLDINNCLSTLPNLQASLSADTRESLDNILPGIEENFAHVQELLPVAQALDSLQPTLLSLPAPPAASSHGPRTRSSHTASSKKRF